MYKIYHILSDLININIDMDSTPCVDGKSKWFFRR